MNNATLAGQKSGRIHYRCRRRRRGYFGTAFSFVTSSVATTTLLAFGATLGIVFGLVITTVSEGKKVVE